MKWFAEVVQALDKSYYVNLTMGGVDSSGKWNEPKLVEGIKEYVPYKELKESIGETTGICFVPLSKLHFESFMGKKYAYVDNTQPHKEGCCLYRYKRPNWD